MSFYVYLPSNGSQRYFPSNRASKFRIKTPTKFEFNPNEYEVGLTEISYICSIKPLTGSNNDNRISITEHKTNALTQDLLLNLNVYTTLQHLVDAINNEIPIDNSGEKRVTLTYDKAKRLSSINLYPNMELTISEKLSYILGYDGVISFRNVISHSIPFNSTSTPSLLAGAYHMFIYSDIVQPQIVGSELVPLLRVVNLSGNESEVITSTFQNPYYLPLARNVFDTISIILCNEFGEELEIDKGMVNITLHFRKNGTRNI